LSAPDIPSPSSAYYADDDDSRWRARFHRVIPGGSHTYAKGDDQFPSNAPPFLVRGQGCRVWDRRGREFIEYGMGLRAVTLGHAYEPVVEAAARQMRLGTNFTRPSSIELECAENLRDLIPGADMVKFAKNGSDVTTAAVKLARAATGRDLVGICADHPFFSTDDWFIGTTSLPAGIPESLRTLTLGFRYNDIASAEELFRKHPGQIACLMLEAERVEEPRDGFLHRLKELCHAHGAVFILDELITGFRWDLAGAQGYYGIEADLSTFGKAIANGFAVSALAGRRELMELGSIDRQTDRVFLLSTTHGAETHALAAAIETMRIYRTRGVVEALWRQGERLRRGVEAAAAGLGVSAHFSLLGKPCSLVYTTRDSHGKASQAFRALFLQELVRRGVLAPSFVVSYSHSDADIDRTVEAVRGALSVYRKALEDGGVENHLEGPPVRPVFPGTPSTGAR
jgi:glutamate-1-semialdehyde 2,1-aminomutase